MTPVATLSAPPGRALVETTLETDRIDTLRRVLRYLPNDATDRDLYELTADYPLRGGKGMRPSLCLASCRAHGGSTEEALDSAAALELLHNAFLVHDDIEDESFVRRGRPTLHVQHGLPLALNAGDALTALSQAPLLANVDRLGPRTALGIMREFHHLTLRTIEGQATELTWRRQRRSGLRPADYLSLVLGKTCWYSTIHPLRIGALIGSRGRIDLDRFNRFGFFLGATFQIHDDVDNLTDRSAGYGKDFGGDIVEGKPTLAVIHLMSVLSEDERLDALRVIGSGAGADSASVGRVIEMMERHGSIEFAVAFAEAMAGAALAELDGAFRDARHVQDLDFLRALVLHLRDPSVRGN